MRSANYCYNYIIKVSSDHQLAWQLYHVCVQYNSMKGLERQYRGYDAYLAYSQHNSDSQHPIGLQGPASNYLLLQGQE